MLREEWKKKNEEALLPCKLGFRSHSPRIAIPSKMALFARIFTFKPQFQPQFLVLLIPWVKRKNTNAITCLKNRDYSSSLPVRYIPPKSSKVNQSENIQPTWDSKDKELCNFPDAIALRNQAAHGGNIAEKSFNFDKKPRYQMQMHASTLVSDVELEDQIDDHDMGVQEHEFMEEPEQVVEKYTIHEKKKMCEHDDVLQAGKTKHDAEKLAIRLLARRAYTMLELKKKLHAKRFSIDIIEAVIGDFQNRGFINDSMYAEAFSRSRWSYSSWGPQRIKHALFQKGVNEDDANKSIKLVFRDEGSNGDEELIHGLSKRSMDQLVVQASKQWLRCHDVPTETRKSRIVRWLQYRGFNWGVISFILNKLEHEYP